MADGTAAAVSAHIIYRAIQWRDIRGRRKEEATDSSGTEFEVTASASFGAGRTQHGPGIDFEVRLEAPASEYELSGVVSFSTALPDVETSPWPWSQEDFTAYTREFVVPLVWAACDQQIRALSTALVDQNVHLPVFSVDDPFRLTVRDLFSEED